MVVGAREWWWAFVIGWVLAEADGGHSWLVTDGGSRASLPYLQGVLGCHLCSSRVAVGSRPRSLMAVLEARCHWSMVAGALVEVGWLVGWLVVMVVGESRRS